MPATKKKSFRKVEPEAVTPIGKTIPQEILESFASVPHQYKIDAIHIHGTSWRLNYWSQWYDDNRVVPTNRIRKSFYVDFIDGILYDKTIQPKERPANK